MTVQKRGPLCPPAATLESLVTGESIEPAVAAHASNCPECTTYLTALRNERAEFNARQPAEMFLRKVERRQTAPPPRRRWLPVLALGLSAAVLLVVAPRLLRPTDVRFKGEAFRVVYKREGMGNAEPVKAEARLKRGDALRFSYVAPTAGQLAIFDLDATGQATVFYPFGAQTSAAVPAGRDDFLPGSIELDQSVGTEWLVAVFDTSPFQTQPLLEQLRAQGGRVGELKLDCGSCRVSTLRIQKQP